MAEKFSQIQELRQEQKLMQNISQQKLLQAQLVELPLPQLIERVNAEMDDNPALEIGAESQEEADVSSDYFDDRLVLMRLRIMTVSVNVKTGSRPWTMPCRALAVTMRIYPSTTTATISARSARTGLSDKRNPSTTI